jgi:hypothetical protein
MTGATARESAMTVRKTNQLSHVFYATPSLSCSIAQSQCVEAFCQRDKIRIIAMVVLFFWAVNWQNGRIQSEGYGTV